MRNMLKIPVNPDMMRISADCLKVTCPKKERPESAMPMMIACLRPMRSERRPIGMPSNNNAEELARDPALQHIDIEEELPAAENDAADNGHPQKETRIPVEGADGLNIVRVEVLKHGVIIR